MGIPHTPVISGINRDGTDHGCQEPCDGRCDGRIRRIQRGAPVSVLNAAADAALLGAGDIRRLATGLGIAPSKRLGQNFVIDPGTVRRIVRVAGVTSGDHVLEVGPGLGSLTLALLEVGASVAAVEIDTRLADRLPLTVAERLPAAAGRLNVINEDALDLTPEDVPGGFATAPFTLVANLPYNVATPIILTLLERFGNLHRFLVMVQKEVADRLVATPGNKTYGTPTVKLAWYGTAEKAGMIGRNVFWPAPNVDSALVRFRRKQLQTSDAVPNPQVSHTRTKIFGIVDAAFAQRRKTLHAALRGLVDDRAFALAGIDPTRRGETLGIEDFTALCEAAYPPASATAAPPNGVSE